ncbi:hypothetical protein KR009_004882 [Drosophila setifemur]|nr:hypothetical protein KR009_004882 [Drosophila setifemur]
MSRKREHSEDLDSANAKRLRRSLREAKNDGSSGNPKQDLKTEQDVGTTSFMADTQPATSKRRESTKKCKIPKSPARKAPIMKAAGRAKKKISEDTKRSSNGKDKVTSKKHRGHDEASNLDLSNPANIDVSNEDAKARSHSNDESGPPVRPKRRTPAPKPKVAKARAPRKKVANKKAGAGKKGAPQLGSTIAHRPWWRFWSRNVEPQEANVDNTPNEQDFDDGEDDEYDDDDPMDNDGGEPNTQQSHGVDLSMGQWIWSTSEIGQQAKFAITEDDNNSEGQGFGKPSTQQSPEADHSRAQRG